ncbi:hypothetical protein OHD13_16660 [Escherichia coli]|nr:hypothetical protein [Escherichia coli]MCW7229619.1 hypothetical protein [Escherichia coli]
MNANSGTLNNVTINENCRVLENCPRTRLKAISLKQWAKLSPGIPCTGAVVRSGTITVRVYDDQPFDRQIVIPAVAPVALSMERAY